jgi:hypothetical protein
MARVRGVSRRMISRGSTVNESGTTSAKTGVAPTWTTAVADEIKVMEGTITSSPGPMPRPMYIADIATVPLAKATACSTSWRLAKASSNSCVAGPLVRMPEAKTRLTAASSSSPKLGHANLMRIGGPSASVFDPSERIVSRVTLYSFAFEDRLHGQIDDP